MRRVAVEIIAALDVQLAAAVNVIPTTANDASILVDFLVALLV